MTGALLTLAASTPVPRDLMLPLPLPAEVLKILLIIFFLLHIFFVNLMVGGSVLTLVFECIGLKRKDFDKLALKIAETVTVNKSLAVVLGVGPILCISLVYTSEFYTANALTGHAWVALIPLITLAFLLTYWHKYSWHGWGTTRKGLHIALGASASVLFLLIPIIFLSNINLMLFPSRWSEVSGFLSSLFIGNVLPRYLHFFSASLAATGLFLCGWFGRSGYRLEDAGLEFDRAQLKRIFYAVVFFFTAFQFIFGPLVLLTLPPPGVTTKVLTVILTGATIALLLLYLLWKELTADNTKIGRLFWPIAGIFSIIVLLMGTGRHLYREASLQTYKLAVAQRTQEFREIEAAYWEENPPSHSSAASENLAGEALFVRNCAMCHRQERSVIGPSIGEITASYAGNPQAIVRWAKDPKPKRPEYPDMPPMAFLGDEVLTAIAEYLLSLDD